MKDRLNGWYMRSWQRVARSDGKGFDFEYVGELYGFARPTEQVKRLKRLLLVGYVALVAVYLLAALVPSAGAMWRWVGLPQMLTLIPLIYLGMSVVRLMLCGEKFPYRDYHAGFLRLKKSCVASLVLLSATLLSELIFTVLYAENAGRELPFVAELALCIGLCAAGLAAAKRFPCVIVEKPKEV